MFINKSGALGRPSGSLSHQELLKCPSLSPVLPPWPTRPLPAKVSRAWGIYGVMSAQIRETQDLVTDADTEALSLAVDD